MNQTPCGPDHPTEQEEEINLLDLVETIAKRWKLIVILPLCAAVVSLVYSLLFPDIYTATARILPTQQDNFLMGLVVNKKVSADQCVALMQSDVIGNAIIDRFDLMREMGWKYRVNALRVLTKKATITAGKKDGIITISVDDRDPKRAANIANAYIDELLKLLDRLNLNGSGTNQKLYEERLAKARADLARAEDVLKAFQSKNKALDITEQAKGTIKGVAELMAQLASEEVKLTAMRQTLTEESSEVKKSEGGHLGPQVQDRPT